MSDKQPKFPFIDPKDDDDDEDITRNYHGGNERSKEAFESIRHTKAGQCRRICELAAQKRAHGVLCDEAEVILKMSHQSCSARFSELARDELLFRSGEKRKTRTGRNANVLVTAEFRPVKT